MRIMYLPCRTAGTHPSSPVWSLEIFRGGRNVDGEAWGPCQCRPGHHSSLPSTSTWRRSVWADQAWSWPRWGHSKVSYSTWLVLQNFSEPDHMDYLFGCSNVTGLDTMAVGWPNLSRYSDHAVFSLGTIAGPLGVGGACTLHTAQTDPLFNFLKI